MVNQLYSCLSRKKHTEYAAGYMQGKATYLESSQANI